MHIYFTNTCVYHKRKSKIKDEYYMIIKGSIQQEDITFTNIYAHNRAPHKYIRQKLTDLKEETLIWQ